MTSTRIPLHRHLTPLQRSASPLRALIPALLLVLVTPLLAGTMTPGFNMNWARKWRDTHYGSGQGSADGYGLAVDTDWLYISGATQDPATGLFQGYVASFDHELNEQWYRRDYIAPTSEYTGVHRVALAADGALIAHATGVENGEAYASVMKLSPGDGSVIWETKIPLGHAWAHIWDGAAGPVIDDDDNIYIATGLGSDGIAFNSEPLLICKLDPDGGILWQRQDRLTDYCPQADGWEDIWEIALDSHGDVYVSATANMLWAEGDLAYGIVKYSAQGDREWFRWKNWGSRYDASRGLAIDDDDNIYVSGNVHTEPDKLPGIWKLDIDGNTLAAAQVAQKARYPYGTVIDADGNLVVHGIASPTSISEFNLYSPDLTLIDTFEYYFPGCSWWDTHTRGSLDPWGNLFLLQYFTDSEYDETFSVGVVKIGDRGPQDIPEPGTGLLVFTGLAFASLLVNRRTRLRRANIGNRHERTS